MVIWTSLMFLQKLTQALILLCATTDAPKTTTKNMHNTTLFCTAR